MSELKTLTDLEVIKIAWDIERAGQAFYEAAAKTSREHRATELFKLLARQETKHEERFGQMFRELDKQITGSEEASQYLFDDEVGGYLRSLTEGMIFPDGPTAEQWVAEHPNPTDILSLAIKAEKDAILFYLEIMSQNIFSYTHSVLEEIIKEEKSHVVMLHSLLNKAEALVSKVSS